MKWAEDQEIARGETVRREAERQKRYELAKQMRAEGHTNDEIRERTGLKLSMLTELFRGLGRRIQ